MKQYRVLPIPEGRNSVGDEGKEENLGGVVIYVGTSEADKQEMSRVAFVRRHAKNPKAPFEQQFASELAKADKLVTLINEKLAEEVAEVETQASEIKAKVAEQINQARHEFNTKINKLREEISKVQGETLTKLDIPEGVDFSKQFEKIANNLVAEAKTDTLL